VVSVDYSFLINNMEFSYSRLTSYEMCKQQWLLNYIFHEPKQSGFFAQYGSFMHSVLEHHLKKEITADEALIFYITNFDKVVTGRAPSEKIRQTFFSQGLEYFNGLDFPHKDIISVEEKIEFEISGIPFVARLDVLSKDNGIILTDNKSHPLKPYSKNHKTDPKKYDLELDQYMRQQILYAYAIKQKYGFYPDIIELNLFRKKEFIVVEFYEDMLQPVIDWAMSTRESIIKTTEWKPTIEYFPCNFLCDMKSSCLYYQNTRGVALG
jgi:hypothetical protein